MKSEDEMMLTDDRGDENFGQCETDIARNWEPEIFIGDLILPSSIDAA